MIPEMRMNNLNCQIDGLKRIEINHLSRVLGSRAHNSNEPVTQVPTAEVFGVRNDLYNILLAS